MQQLVTQTITLHSTAQSKPVMGKLFKEGAKGKEKKL